MDDAKVTLCNRGVMVEAARQCPKDRKKYRALVQMKLRKFQEEILLTTVFFRTTLPCSGGCHLERGGMPLYFADGINCEKGATTENQGAGVNYMGYGVYVDDCVLSDLT